MRIWPSTFRRILRAKTPILVLILSLTVLSVLPSALTPARAVNQSGPTLWQPFGPYANRVLITVYADFAAMFTAFENGQIDLTDWQVESPVTQQTYGLNPDFFLTSAIDELGIFELDVNHHNSFMGVAQQENRVVDPFTSPSTKQPTAAGIEVRRGIAHLLDKPDFVNVAALNGLAKYVDIQAPPAQGLQPGGNPQASQLSAALRAEDCAAHPWFTPCDASNPPVSAYNLSPDSNAVPGFAFANHGYSGVNDLRAACDHFVAAGFTITGAGGCLAVAQGTAHLNSAGTINYYIRTHPPRKAAGQAIMTGLTNLFGGAAGTFLYGTNAAPTYYTITQVSDIVFRTAPDKDDWHIYTGGWQLGSTPDHLYSLYYSSFASDDCGGKKSTFAQNYLFYCSPAYDQEGALGQFAANLADANTHFTNAAVIANRNVMTVPFYSGAGIKYVALNGWDGVVSQSGHGFQTGFWSLLNMRCKPGYVATPPYQPGAGDCTTIRRGFSQEVHKLSPFQATTVWDFEVIGNIYDSMLAVNPLTAGVGQQIIDWMTTKHTSSFDGTITTQTWTLRNDLKWHDGQPVTAADVVYTIKAYRDVPSANFQPSVANVIDAVALDTRTVKVTLSQQSPFFELNIGGLAIIPKHIWSPICGDPPSSASSCADPAFDPMTAGIMVGSAAYQCLNINTNAVGGSCTQTAGGAIGTQDVVLGGRVLLTRYNGYMRSSPTVEDSSLGRISWADADNSGKVDILDIAAAALKFGVNDAYWNHPIFGTDPTKVDIGEIATVAIYFDHGITSPFAPGALVGLGDMDPFH